MTKYVIEHWDGSVPPRRKPGPKRGSRRFDNDEIVRKAATELIQGSHRSANQAAMAHLSEFESGSHGTGKRDVFAKRILEYEKEYRLQDCRSIDVEK